MNFEIESLRIWLAWLKTDHARLPCKMRLALQYPAWRRSLESGRSPLTDAVLWINFGASFFIESVLAPEWIVYEFGSGGSTLFYSKRVKRVFCVEHDTGWFERVKTELTRRGLTNCDCRLIPPELSTFPHVDPENPTDYGSSDENYKGYTFRRYASSIDSFPDGFFDLVSIDGRARPSCIYHAHRKVTVGGYLMLDNSNRPEYQRARELISGWDKHEFSGPVPYQNTFSETCIWRRPDLI
jgi:hypothetical protein